MFPVFILFLIAIASAPIDFFWPWPGLLGLRLLLAGTGLILAAKALAPRERKFMQSVTSYALLSLASVALFVLLQLVPFQPFANPFWESAAAALNQGVANTISIDVGATLLVFARLSLAASLLLLGAAVAIDRTRAEWLLIALTVVAGLVLESLLFGVILPASFGVAVQKDLGDDTFTFASLALILAAATSNFVFERFETRRSKQKHSILQFMIQEGACAFVFVVSAAVLLQSQDAAVVYVAISGIGVLLLIILVRRLGLGPLAGIAIALLPLLIGVLIAGAARLRTNDLLLGYSAASEAVLELTHRMVIDAPWAGTGAGTSESLRRLYGSLGEPSGDTPLASSAAIIAIDLGRVAFWAIAGLGFILFIRLLRGALLRGRDSFYPAAGAACLFSILLGGFVNAGFLATPNYMFASAILGMALAQSASRSL